MILHLLATNGRSAVTADDEPFLNLLATSCNLDHEYGKYARMVRGLLCRAVSPLVYKARRNGAIDKGNEWLAPVVEQQLGTVDDAQAWLRRVESVPTQSHHGEALPPSPGDRVLNQVLQTVKGLSASRYNASIDQGVGQVPGHEDAQHHPSSPDTINHPSLSQTDNSNNIVSASSPRKNLPSPVDTRLAQASYPIMSSPRRHTSSFPNPSTRSPGTPTAPPTPTTPRPRSSLTSSPLLERFRLSKDTSPSLDSVLRTSKSPFLSSFSPSPVAGSAERAVLFSPQQHTEQPERPGSQEQVPLRDGRLRSRVRSTHQANNQDDKQRSSAHVSQENLKLEPSLTPVPKIPYHGPLIDLGNASPELASLKSLIPSPAQPSASSHNMESQNAGSDNAADGPKTPVRASPEDIKRKEPPHGLHVSVSGGDGAVTSPTRSAQSYGGSGQDQGSALQMLQSLSAVGLQDVQPPDPFGPVAPAHQQHRYGQVPNVPGLTATGLAGVREHVLPVLPDRLGPAPLLPDTETYSRGLEERATAIRHHIQQIHRLQQEMVTIYAAKHQVDIKKKEAAVQTAMGTDVQSLLLSNLRSMTDDVSIGQLMRLPSPPGLRFGNMASSAAPSEPRETEKKPGDIDALAALLGLGQDKI